MTISVVTEKDIPELLDSIPDSSHLDPGVSSDLLPIIRPTLPQLEDVLSVIRNSYDTGQVTTGQVGRRLEQAIERFTGAKHCVTVSSGTSGLILSFAALGFQEGSEVVLPSFTFAATAQAVVWNRLVPVYVDCLHGTMTIDPNEVVKAIGPKTAAICPVTVFGLPPDIHALEAISRQYGISLMCDSAQGLGSTYDGRPAGGFGLLEVFSLSPTKVITAIEGGIITTNDDHLAQKLRSMRDYGKGPDGEEMVYNGLSARMSEFHAAVGLLCLSNAESLLRSRLRLITTYRERTAGLRGCRVQDFPSDRTSSGNYFTLLIDKGARVDRDSVRDELARCRVQSKRYFHPPVHSQKALKDFPHRIVGDLANTWSCSRASLALPLYSHMTDAQQQRICEALERLLT